MRRVIHLKSIALTTMKGENRYFNQAEASLTHEGRFLVVTPDGGPRWYFPTNNLQHFTIRNCEEGE